MQVFNSKKEPIQLASSPFAQGGEGAVYQVLSSPYTDCCVKIYHPGKIATREQKLAYMIGHPIGGSQNNSRLLICWPIDFVWSKGQKIGIIMPKAFDGSTTLYDLCTLKDSVTSFSRVDSKGLANRLTLLANLCTALRDIHAAGYVLSDLKPQNILFTPFGSISVIDLDSVQVSNNGRVLYPASAYDADYAYPKELISLQQTETITEDWDSFSFAIVAYQVLLGLHPFTCSTNAKDESGQVITGRQALMFNNFFVFGPRRKEILTCPKPHERFSQLDKRLQKLFLQALDVCQKPPSIEEWHDVLSFVANADSKRTNKTSTGHKQTSRSCAVSDASHVTPPPTFDIPPKTKRTEVPKRQSISNADEGARQAAALQRAELVRMTNSILSSTHDRKACKLKDGTGSVMTFGPFVDDGKQLSLMKEKGRSLNDHSMFLKAYLNGDTWYQIERKFFEHTFLAFAIMTFILLVISFVLWIIDIVFGVGKAQDILQYSLGIFALLFLGYISWSLFTKPKESVLYAGLLKANTGDYEGALKQWNSGHYTRRYKKDIEYNRKKLRSAIKEEEKQQEERLGKYFVSYNSHSRSLVVRFPHDWEYPSCIIDDDITLEYPARILDNHGCMKVLDDAIKLSCIKPTPRYKVFNVAVALMQWNGN